MKHRHLFQLCLFFLLFNATEGLSDNLLLVVVDTLRADRLNCYGYDQSETPNVDRWANEGILFERAFTEYPVTLPAHATLLTGIYPVSHGIRDNAGQTLAPEHRTLAELFRERGYSTGAFVGSYVLSSEFGVGQGFEHFDEEFDQSIENVGSATALQRSSEQVTTAFLNWLEGVGQRPFFAFVHFFDPHTPRPRGYDWEVEQVDQSIGRIDQYLRQKELLETTTIVFLSDHGESLGEHGEGGHGFFLYDSTLHIPLIIRSPQGRFPSKQRISATVSLADVFPTVVDLFGMNPPETVQGRSLARLLLGKSWQTREVYSETYIPNLHLGWAPLRSCVWDSYKFIDAPRPELYDLSVDPGEKSNLYSRNQSLAARLRQKLDEFSTKFGKHPVATANPAPSRERRERLAALGYFSLGRTIEAGEWAKGVDPKDRIGVFQNYHQVLNEMAQGVTTPQILDRIEALKVAAPEVTRFTYLEARANDLLKHWITAEAKYREVLLHEPENSVASGQLGRVLVQVGKLDEAEKIFLTILEVDPGDFGARNNLAGLYRMTGRPDLAIEQMKRITESRPDYATGWQNLSLLYGQTKQLPEAEAAIRKAIQLEPRRSSAYKQLARILAALGRMSEAEEVEAAVMRLEGAPINP